jgi:hypothetical protein
MFPEKYKTNAGKFQLPSYSSKELGKHHFFELLCWNPQAIKAVAVLWNGRPNLSLVDLYNFVAE